MGTKKLLIVGAVIALVVVVAITLAPKKPTVPSSVTKVGVILPLTGILSEMGQYEQQAMELALRQLKASGTNHIDLVFEDGKGDNKAVAAAANKLLDVDHVKVLITSTTGASLTAQPIAERHDTPLLAFCMSSDVASKSPTTVRFYIGIEEESKAIIEYLRTLPKDTRVGVLHASVAVWTTAVSDIYNPFFNEFFTKPALIEEYSLTDKDFRSQLIKFKKDVSVLVLLGYGFEYPPIFTQMAELRIRDKTQILGGWGFLYTTLPPETVEGIRVAGPMYVFSKSAPGTQFEKSFSEAYGRKPNFDAAFAYEVIKKTPAILQILDQSGASNLKKGLSEMGTMQGAMGDYHFERDGNMIVDTAVGVFKGGQIVGE